MNVDDYLKITYGIFTNHINNACVKDNKQQDIIHHVKSNNKHHTLKDIIGSIEGLLGI